MCLRVIVRKCFCLHTPGLTKGSCHWSIIDPFSVSVSYGLTNIDTALSSEMAGSSSRCTNRSQPIMAVKYRRKEARWARWGERGEASEAGEVRRARRGEVSEVRQAASEAGGRRGEARGVPVLLGPGWLICLEELKRLDRILLLWCMWLCTFTYSKGEFHPK